MTHAVDPTPTGPMVAWQRKLEAGQLELQQCVDCARHVFYPRLICPHCGGASLNWVPVTGGGTVHSVTVVQRRPEQGGPYNVVLVDLDEGVRMMSRVDGIAPEAVAIGQRVCAFVGELDGKAVVLFRPPPA